MSDEVLKMIKDKEVQYVDLRFNDLAWKDAARHFRRVDDR